MFSVWVDQVRANKFLQINKVLPSHMRRQHLIEKLGLFAETLFELSYSTTSIKNLLLTGVERVAITAYVCVDCTILLSAASFKCVAT